MVEHLHTVGDVVDKLGGTAEVARLTNNSQQVVSNWRRRGRMAADVFVIMTTELKRLGCTAPPELWTIRGAEPESAPCGAAS